MKKVVYYILRRIDGKTCAGPMETYDDAYWFWAEEFDGSDAFAITLVEEDIT